MHLTFPQRSAYRWSWHYHLFTQVCDPRETQAIRCNHDGWYTYDHDWVAVAERHRMPECAAKMTLKAFWRERREGNAAVGEFILKVVYYVENGSIADRIVISKHVMAFARLLATRVFRLNPVTLPCCLIQNILTWSAEAKKEIPYKKGSWRTSGPQWVSQSYP